MKTKGFTLIELLAVIVILAIIALIAIPIVLNIIDSSKEESNERSKELYLEAVKEAIARKNLISEFNPETCEVNSTGNLTCDKGELTVEISGNRPTGGAIAFENGNIIEETLVFDGSTPKSLSSKFGRDSWSTIIANVKTGNIDDYKVGDTKEINLGELGIHTVRVANKSTLEKCNEPGFSQTACGFVIEFADIITTHSFLGEDAECDEYEGCSNKGGWKDSEIRRYLNDEKDNNSIYNALPKEIRNNIKDTYVVSGHGPNDKENFITTDKIYLLSAGEIFRDVTQDECEGIFLESYPYDCRGYDLDNFTDSVMTRQLDYYENKEVTTCSCTNAPLKEIALEYVPDEQYYWARYMWWLRSVFSDHSFSSGVGNFDDVGHASIFSVQLGSSDEFGVSPAFRIG